MVALNSFLFTILFSLLFFIFTIQDSSGGFTTLDVVYIIILLIAFSLFFEIIVCSIIRLTSGHYEIFLNLARCIFILYMVYSLNLSLNEEFADLRKLVRFGIYGVICFISYSAFNFIRENSTKGGYLNAFLFIVTIGLGLNGNFISNPSEKTSIANPVFEDLLLNPEEVNFKEKPNVYMISFDALQSYSLVEKYLGIPSTAYHKVLDNHFRKIPNFFADRVPSKQS